MRRLCFALAASAVGFAQQPIPDYFPLQVGNQWVYRSGRTASVTGTQQVGDTTYAVLQSRFGSVPSSAMLVRSDGAGKIYQYDPGKQQEALLYDFTRPVSSPTNIGQPYTITTAGHYSGPLGDFDNAFEIGQRDSLTGSTETFLPYIGEVSSSFFNTAGSAALVPPFVEDLVYARIADTTVVSSKEWGFGLTVDRAVYSLHPGQTYSCGVATSPAAVAPYIPCAQARLALRLVGSDPVRLSFPTQQIYELELRDAAGNLIWRLSDNKKFAATPRDLVIGPGEVDFSENVLLYTTPFPDASNSLLPPGVYRLSATLLDMPGGSASASVTLTVIP